MRGGHWLVMWSVMREVRDLSSCVSGWCQCAIHSHAQWHLSLMAAALRWLHVNGQGSAAEATLPQLAFHFTVSKRAHKHRNSRSKCLQAALVAALGQLWLTAPCVVALQRTEVECRIDALLTPCLSAQLCFVNDGRF